jgi:lipoate-protein ligase A
VDHQQFCESVLTEFEREYNQGISVRPTIIDESTLHDLPEQVEKTRQELTTWEWMYGQTPEFTHTLDKSFDWGHVVRERTTKP